MSNIVASLSSATPCFIGLLFLPMIYRHLEAFQGEAKMASWRICTKCFSFLGSEADDNIEEAPTSHPLQAPVLSRSRSRRGTLSLYRRMNRDYFMKNALRRTIFIHEWRSIRKRTTKLFDAYERVNKKLTKHFPCCGVLIS